MIPVNMSDTHELLKQELLLLHTKWHFFTTLYCTSDENIALLDNSAQLFFVILGDILRDDIIVSVCAITDPASSRVRGLDRNNLSLAYLNSLIPAGDAPLIKQTTQLLGNAKASWESFRDHRNCRIAHRDLESVLKKSDELIPTITISNVDAALANIGDILNAIEVFYNGRGTKYQRIYGTGDANDLLEFLSRSFELKKYYNHKEFGWPLE